MRGQEQHTPSCAREEGDSFNMAIPSEAGTSLNGEQLQRALVVLEREREALALSPRQETLYRRLRVCFRGVMALFCLFWLIGIWFASGAAPTEPPVGVAIPVVLLLALAMLAAAVLFAIMAVLLAMNVPLMVRLLKQAVLIRRAGLGDVLTHLRSRLSRPRRTGRMLLLVGSLYMGATLIIGSIVFSLIPAGRIAGSMTEGGAAYGASRWATVAIAGILGVAMVAVPLMQRFKERLALLGDVESLRASLCEAVATESDTGAAIRLSEDTVERLAVIERKQITREQTEAILRGGRASTRYAVLSNSDVDASRSSLRAEERIRLEEVLVGLSQDPRPPSAVMDQSASRWQVPVVDGKVALIYEVDDAARLLKLMGLESNGPAGAVTHD